MQRRSEAARSGKMKRALIAVAMLILVPVLAFVGLIASTFAGNKELVDGIELPGAARLIKDGFVALFVLPAGDKEVALVDCGNDEKGAAVLAELTRRGLGPEAVKAIFLTHGHPDHIAGCHLFTSAKIYAFAGDVPVANGTGRSKGFLPSKMETPEAKRTKVTDTVTDGQVVSVGTLNVKVFAVPGHTAGSASYLANNTLYMGDNGTGASNGTMKPAPWVFSDDSAQNQRSLEALGKRITREGDVVTVLAFAHSGPFEGAEALTSFHVKE